MVYKWRNGITEVIICGHSGDRFWALPKGTPRKGERLEDTALREVGEETGLKIEVVDKIGYVQYWFEENGVRYFKTVYYYLMKPVGGDLSGHDHEFDEVRWCEISEALDLLTYQIDIDVVRRAGEMVQPRRPETDLS
ncbi:MAG: NUDIX domain-containing protein [Dehalococcoidia bacterium]|nr:NUDIX domain-containing protein [Dehalococcoidia bacterium]